MYDYLRRTPFTIYGGPAKRPRSIWLKDETRQETGAFKFRGNIAKLSRSRGHFNVVAASTGNHGLGLSTAARALGLSATVFVPATTPLKKQDGIRRAGAELIRVAGDYDSCEQAARAYSASHSHLYVSSFDDDEIIEGHRSLFREVDEAGIRFDTVFVPTGGGGLLSACIRHWGGRVKRIVGVESASAPAMKMSLDCRQRVYLPRAEGTAEGLLVRRVGEIAFRLCSQFRPQIVTVTDQQMEQAVRLLWQHNGIRAETAAAASLAAALSYPAPLGNCLCVVSGGNIDDEYFSRILSEAEAVG